MIEDKYAMSAATSSSSPSAVDDQQPYFKGIIQDVQVSNGSHAMTVELYPLNEEGLQLPPPFGEVTIDGGSVLKGEVSDDLCRSAPCAHGASCKNTWNDFVCICPRGYKGRVCQEIEFCELNRCPGESICQNLDDGFECIANVTFQGHQPAPLSFSFVRSSVPLPADESMYHSIEISYRTKRGGTLLYVSDHDMFFEVVAEGSEVIIRWRLLEEILEVARFANESADYEWATLFIKIEADKLEAGWKGWDSLAAENSVAAIAKPINHSAYKHLLEGEFPIYLGGVPIPDSNDIMMLSNQSTATQTASKKMYKGCLGETRINGYLLPFYPYNEIYSDNTILRPHYVLNTAKPREGCTVCFQEDCRNEGVCSAPSEKYACDCPLGYDQDDCSEDIDECLTAECTNNSTCVDGIANYTCTCLPGYEGELCEHEIDECDPMPCHNGGICTDQIAAFVCECTEDYAGPTCEILRLVTCENQPCRNGSTCIDGFSEFCLPD